MQDWNYLHTNDMELTLELGCVKYPEHGQLATFWQENREPLLLYIEAVHIGVKGRQSSRGSGFFESVSFSRIQIQMKTKIPTKTVFSKLVVSLSKNMIKCLLNVK